MCSRVTKYKFSPLLGKLFTFGPIRPSQSYLVLNLLESSFFPSTASDVFARSLLSLPVSIAASYSIQSASEIAARGKGIIRSETNAVKTISSDFSIVNGANVNGVVSFLVTRGFSWFFWDGKIL